MEPTVGFIQDLGNGLVLRQAEPSDSDRLAAFNARIHGEDPNDALALEAWTRDLLERPHPTFRPGDFLIVEDPSVGQIVSSTNLISQTWSYEGIPFEVGRPELVGTDPAYRGRGLVRAQFDVLHRWSSERGELVQAITGIPNFYRQYGYEMGLELSGGWVGYAPQVPDLTEGQEEPYHIRPATETDLEWLEDAYTRNSRQYLINPVRNAALWNYELQGRSANNINRFELRIIENVARQRVGYLFHPPSLWGTMQAATDFGLEANVSYLAVIPSVILYLWAIGTQKAVENDKALQAFGFWFGSDHPAYHAGKNRLVSQRKPYAFYVRVPDLSAFLTCIRPVLEERLAQSVCAGHSGELKISFYQSGLRLVLENRCIKTIEPWKPAINQDTGDFSFPALTFLQLIFGYRSLAEIQYAYADCGGKEEAAILLQSLFIKKPSGIWPIS